MKLEEQRQTNLSTGDEKHLTRRHLLRTLSAGAVAATVGAAFERTFASAGVRSATADNHAPPVPEGGANEAMTRGQRRSI
jgi:hypothetical protein